jgi:hypothetical protein
MLIPNTMLNVESRKIEEVTITGPNLAECLTYCGKHNLKWVGQSATENYVRGDGSIGVLFAVRAVRELTLVEA